MEEGEGWREAGEVTNDERYTCFSGVIGGPQGPRGREGEWKKKRL